MKLSKKIKLLQGVTAIRVKLGLTQQALAQYIGISESTISMVENGRRHLPAAALAKISELEISVEKEAMSAKTPLPAKVAEPLHCDTILQARKKADLLHRQELQYRLNRMEERYAEIAGSLSLLQHLLEVMGRSGNELLAQQHSYLSRKLKNCDKTTRLTLRSKIAMLDMVIAGREETAPAFKTSLKVMGIPALAC